MTAEVRLTLTPIEEIKAVVDVLAGLGIDPLHLHVDGKRSTNPRPDIHMWIRFRTDFERVCAAFEAGPVEERRACPHGQREWWATSETSARKLLIRCVSFDHHHDWEPRTAEAKR